MQKLYKKNVSIDTIIELKSINKIIELKIYQLQYWQNVQ